MRYEDLQNFITIIDVKVSSVYRREHNFSCHYLNQCLQSGNGGSGGGGWWWVVVVVVETNYSVKLKLKLNKNQKYRIFIGRITIQYSETL